MISSLFFADNQMERLAANGESGTTMDDELFTEMEGLVESDEHGLYLPGEFGGHIQSISTNSHLNSDQSNGQTEVLQFDHGQQYHAHVQSVGTSRVVKNPKKSLTDKKYREKKKQKEIEKDLEINSLRGENERLRGENEDLFSENVKLKGEKEGLNCENNNLKGGNERLIDENERLKGENKSLRSENERLRDEIANTNFDDEISEEGDNNSSLKKAVDTLKSDVERLVLEFNKQNDQLQSLSERLDFIGKKQKKLVRGLFKPLEKLKRSLFCGKD